MNEETQRQEIVRLFFTEDLLVNQISVKLGRSRQWVHKWLNRYNADQEGLWYKEQSRRPKSHPQKISTNDEELICKTRRDLQETPFAQIGAINIQYTLHAQGNRMLPLWTINRVLKRNGLITKPKRYQAKGYPYPLLFFDTQQMDLIGPRYLGTKKRFYCVSVINIQTHVAGSYPKLNKGSINIAEALIEHWKRHGLPDALQLDNEMVFRGSNRYPRSLGIVLRLALSLGIVPVFIPVGEPWRNGVVERYNQTYERHVLQSVYCQSIIELKEASKSFTLFHNRNHRYSSQANKTPKQATTELGEPFYLDNDFQLPKIVPLDQGVIIFVRFIRSNCLLTILGTTFKVNCCLEYSYVVAELIIELHVLVVKQDNTIYHSFNFLMPVDW